jgi:periplasmic divalent cation tolerance protein
MSSKLKVPSSKSSRALAVVLVTAPDMRVARKLARAALDGRLVACANLVPGVESHYWWQGKIERGSEVLLMLKTTRARLAKLEKLVLKLHPYDTPEFVVMETSRVTKRYLKWVLGVVNYFKVQSSKSKVQSPKSKVQSRK